MYSIIEHPEGISGVTQRSCFSLHYSSWVWGGKQFHRGSPHPFWTRSEAQETYEKLTCVTPQTCLPGKHVKGCPAGRQL